MSNPHPGSDDALHPDKHPDAVDGAPFDTLGTPGADGSGALEATRPVDDAETTQVIPPAERDPHGSGEDDDFDAKTTTRTGMIWATTIIALVLLVLLIIFVAQNQTTAPLRFFAWEGTVSMGLTVVAASVAGGIVVAMAGAARLIALRAQRRKRRKALKQR
ncbi:lipopolysaccharide assembly protein LapA domain-containing protein [Zafaria sp. Z1313]|uniref:lipopolysaccharide assembly protein LapA domain-containing protein n=1 Tax=Zafaria sp. Z1313 TaxID=3423202 RepID=UPI003D303C82